MPELNRKPPTAVRRELRREVGFGCPVEGCGIPYLEYHHFDPEWHVEKHHRPEGMIALCSTHHAKADAWTIEQCRELKRNPHTAEVSGRFEWMRREVVAIIGGNYYHETPNMVVFRDRPIIWFERDDRGYLLLSIRMLSISGQPRTELTANDWEILGEPIEVDSPPNGSFLQVKYENGDEVGIRFKKWDSAEKLREVHPRILVLGDQIRFPLVTAEVHLSVGGTDIRFNSKKSELGGLQMQGNVISRCGNGLVFE